MTIRFPLKNFLSRFFNKENIMIQSLTGNTVEKHLQVFSHLNRKTNNKIKINLSFRYFINFRNFLQKLIFQINYKNLKVCFDNIKWYFGNENVQCGLATSLLAISMLSKKPSFVWAVEKNTPPNSTKTWVTLFKDFSHNYFSVKLWREYLYQKIFVAKEFLPVLLFTSGFICGFGAVVVTGYAIQVCPDALSPDTLVNLQNLYNVLEQQFFSMSYKFSVCKDNHFNCVNDNRRAIDLLKMTTKVLAKYNPELEISVPPVLPFPNYDGLQAPNNTSFTLPERIKN